VASRTVAFSLFAKLILCGLLPWGSAFRQVLILPSQSPQATPASPDQTSQLSPSATLDITLLGPNNLPIAESAALTLVTASGQIYKQAITKTAHLLCADLPAMQYEIQVVVPGFARAAQRADVDGSNMVHVNFLLRPSNREDKFYPPTSDDPEINYVFATYASRLGNWPMANSYLTKTLQLRPDHIPAMVSLGEALLNEDHSLEARIYLERAAKLDPSYWRAEEVLARLSWRDGAVDEAARHARRALDLGHDEASSAAPLLARALAAQSAAALRLYLMDHANDLAAKKQLDALTKSAQLDAPDSRTPTETGERPSKSASRHTILPASSHWRPPDVDNDIPAVEPGTQCDFEEVLNKAGHRIDEFVDNLQRFTATESLLYESIDRSGNATHTLNKRYDYMVSIEKLRPGILGVEEYLGGGAPLADSSGGVTSKGLPALLLIFHPYYSSDFSMTCEGLADWKGARSWQVSFRQRDDKPNRIRAYRLGWNTPARAVPLRGRAWFLADSYQIVALQTDLVAPLPDLRLAVDHTSIEYGPVHFASRGLDMWVPQSAEVYSDLRGKLIHQRMTFTNYLLFSVDDKQRISPPKIIPEIPQTP